MLTDEEIKLIARDGAKGMAFVLGFATALKKLRQAQQDHYEVSLTPDEAGAVLQAFSLLREGRSQEVERPKRGGRVPSGSPPPPPKNQASPPLPPPPPA